MAVDRRGREISFLEAGFVTEVRNPVGFFPAVPEPFIGIEIVETEIVGLIETHAVEDKEFSFRSDKTRVGDSSRAKVRLGFCGDIPAVPRIPLLRDRVLHVANDVQRGNRGERIDERRIRIGEQQHVAFVNPLEAPDARAVESDTRREGTFVEFIPGNREMLPLTQHVAEAQVDDVDIMRCDCLEDITAVLFRSLWLCCAHRNSLSALLVILSYGFLVSSFLSTWKEQRLFWSPRHPARIGSWRAVFQASRCFRYGS